ncbi:class III extradiol ring-cleavage dioxygenase family protein [Thermocatellispora tengchongensis]|uniref:hypothetical protein n=1 Tax=Thermocatellispora tengchongensis TaxID=1073253 RepID=UPI0036381D54
MALLVMADGSACLSEKAPGYLDPRARSYDDHVRHVLEGADTQALAALDPEEAEELSFAGRAALQVLAGAACDARERGGFRERKVYYEEPYGVGYFVSLWTRRADAPERAQRARLGTRMRSRSWARVMGPE